MTDNPTTRQTITDSRTDQTRPSGLIDSLLGFKSLLTQPPVIAGIILLLTAALAAGQFAWGKAIICLIAIPLSAIVFFSRIKSKTNHPLFKFWIILISIPLIISVFQTFILPYSIAVDLSENRLDWLTNSDLESPSIRISYDAFRTRNIALTLITAVALVLVTGTSSRPKRLFLSLGAMLAIIITILCIIAPIRSFFGDSIRFPGLPIAEGRRFVSVFNNPNHFGFFLVVSTPVALAALIRWVRRGNRAGSQRAVRYSLLVGFGLLSGLCWLLTLSRGAIASGAFGLAAFAFLSRSAFDWRKETTVAVIGACVSAGLVAAGVDWTKISDRLATVDISMAQRLDIWNRTLELIADHPIIGTGARAYREAFRPYAPVSVSGDWPYSHNAFLTFASEFGVPALICLIASVVLWGRTVGRSYIRLANANRQNLTTDPYDILIPAAALSALTGGLIASIVDSGPFVPLNLLVISAISSAALLTAIKPVQPQKSRFLIRKASAAVAIFSAALLSGWALNQSVAILRAQSITERLFSPADGIVSFTTLPNGKTVSVVKRLSPDSLKDALAADPLDAVAAAEAARSAVETLRSFQAAARAELSALSASMAGKSNAERLEIFAAIDALDERTRRQTETLFRQAAADADALAALRPADPLVWNLRAVLSADRIERAVRQSIPCSQEDIQSALNAAVRLARASTTRPDYSRQATQTALLAFAAAPSTNSIASVSDARRIAVSLIRQEAILTAQPAALRKRIAEFISFGLSADDLDAAFNGLPSARFSLLQSLFDRKSYSDALRIANALLRDPRFKPRLPEYSAFLSLGIRAGDGDLILDALDGLRYLDADGQISLYDIARRESDKPGVKHWLSRQLDSVCSAETAGLLLRAYHLHHSGSSVSARRLLLSPDNAIPEFWRRQILAEIALALGENETAAAEAQAALNERQGNARSRRTMTDALKPKRATPEMATRNEPTNDSDAPLPDVKLRPLDRRLSDSPSDRGTGGRKRLSAWD